MPAVDASAVVDLLDPEVPDDAPARLLLDKLIASGSELVAPSLLWLEVSNVLLTGVRRGRWDGAAADSAFELARRYDNWPVDGMVYVALAERLRTEFYTADGRLRARLSHLSWVRGVEG
jgi:predicted nucleic acid-binding protein